ncbi:FAD:protein FMN transferase [Roseiflexus sp.]|uniref:FAD:protein FMN transferase n=1 Tax=Roseiflexus sp. TaxID=2562120 RepID=UPI0021DBD4B9|nr:FAD:protein FMN transferase [Roseiflexus sp.]GIV99511.1 MAG: FAD:protein FMN transferase [Roseiflexus sp.]
MPSIAFQSMGCQMHAFLDGNDDAATRMLRAVPRWFAEWERILSRFRSDSELSALNTRAGEGWVRASRTLWEVLNDALVAARLSDGLVTPTVLTALEAAGYDRDFAQIAAGAPAQSSASLPASGDWRAIRLDPQRRTVALPPGMRLDLNGVAKGWAATRAAQRLAAHGPALVDAGGDIAVRGARAGGEPWAIGIANPFQPDEPLDVVLLTDGGVATSGRDVRRWRQGSVERHHIIDPRTGAPAETDVLAVTVIAPSLLEAEVAAKVVVILGSVAGMEWLSARPWLASLIVTDAQEVLHTATFEQFRWHEPEDMEVVYE